MAHFARLDENNIVDMVIVVSNDDIIDSSGEESENIGIEFCTALIPGKWVQTSYNRKFRKNFAGVGYLYSEQMDAFIPPQPFDSWVLDEERCTWGPPIQYPDDGKWLWDEGSLSWVELSEG